MSERIAFYNLDNNRDDDVVRDELLAAADRGYALLGLVETIGNRLIDLKGYERISDNTTRSRQNIAAYVRKDLPITKVDWHDCTFRWPRTEGPGIHEPRSWLLLEAGQRETQVLIGHQPPRYVDGAVAGQQEGIEVCERYMAPWTRERWSSRLSKHQRAARKKPRLALADWNRRSGEPGPGPDVLAQRIGGKVAGDGIDAMVSRNVEVLDWRYVRQVAGVALRSDHKRAFEVVVRSL